jgi:glycyl-tRNA synthetase beta chain
MTEPCSPLPRSAEGELLLELLSEEIPAGMQRRAIAELTGLLRDRLAAAEIPAAEVRGYVTPRRLTVIAWGIPTGQPDRSEERRGPRVGAPAPAIEGFLRSAGIASIEECETRDTGRGKFYFATINRPGRPAAEVLPELVRSAVFELSWPKSMRYPASSLRWVRPLTSVVCLFEGEVLPLPFDRVPVGRITRGHRFLSPDEICVANAAEYLVRLGEARVVLDQERRKETIRKDLEETAAMKGLSINTDPNLLEEVAGLVEYPVVLMGSVDVDFMTLPREVLATVMRVHQKYFSCRYPDGTSAPHFFFVANSLATDGGRTIVAGNHRVLRARLADARFFWEQDLKIRLEDRVEALKQRIFHDKLGTVYDKAERIAALAKSLAGLGRFTSDSVESADSGCARRAARLAKADLSTGMVGEFPELQGIMGGYYYEIQHRFENFDVQKQLENVAIAVAISDHYKPLGPTDSCPKTPESIIVALADKIDTLVAFFAIGEKPTGSRDPFALRRAALGVIRLILESERGLRLPLSTVFKDAFDSLQRRLNLIELVESGVRDPTDELLAFIADRLKVHLREYGFRHDLIAAVFAPAGAGKVEDDLMRLHDRVFALGGFLASVDGANLLTAFRRASNIVAIEERHYDCRYDHPPEMERFVLLEEQTLALRLAEVDKNLEIRLGEEDFVGAMSLLASLRQPIDEFFDKVTVNTEEPRLRENRLRLLSRIRDTMNRVANFSLIEG